MMPTSLPQSSFHLTLFRGSWLPSIEGPLALRRQISLTLRFSSKIIIKAKFLVNIYSYAQTKFRQKSPIRA